MQSPYTLQTFFNDLDNILDNNRPNRSFTELFSLNFIKYDTFRIASLQNSLQEYDSKTLSELIENNKSLKKVSWPVFENFILKYLICIRDFDPWSSINSIDLFISVFEFESLLFNPKSNLHDKLTRLLVPVFYETMPLIISFSELTDVMSMKIHNRVFDYPRLTHISSVLLKALNNIRSTSELNTELNLDKINLLIQISINLCEVYYKIGSPVLCSNVFSNINILNLNRKFIKKSSFIEFRFIMGKYYAHQSNFSISYHHLNECFKSLKLNSCPLSTITTILKYLIPVGLIVGKVANIQQLKSKFFGQNAMVNENSNELNTLNTLLNLYEPLIIEYKSGHIYGIYECISLNEEYWKKIGLWIPMLQRLRIPVFRNLTYKLWKLNNETLTFNILKHGVLISMQGLDQLKPVYHITNQSCLQINDIFIANMVTSLNFNGFMKIKMTGPTSFVLGKNDTFPNMYTIVYGRYPMNPREAWLDR
jgi:hypothetical protein